MNTEQALRFGRANHLVGIIGTPSGTRGKVGVIVLNAGMVHRIGPFRLHVELTRALNGCGYPTLRLDLSTLGDSGATGESVSHTEQVRADIRDAMTTLEKHTGCTQFVLTGLCSGAENAYLGACTEAGVIGTVFLDGYAYRTPGFYLRHYLPRMANPVRALRFIGRLLRPAKPHAGADFAVEYPPREEVQTNLERMLDRGLKLCFIFSGGASGYFNHQRQFRECYGRIARDPGVDIHFLKESDHTFILNDDRKQLLGIIEQWFRHHLPITTPDRHP
jgi:dienelactone hydrolase